MKRPSRAIACLLVGVVFAVVLFGGTAGKAAANGITTCTGSADNFPAEVGTLSGTYSGNVQISGVCAVDAGATTINGNVTVLPGSSLIAAFASSPLTVTRNVNIQTGGTLIMGCFAESFGCFDDPDQDNPTLNGPAVVGGNIIASDPLGVIVHDATIGGNVVQDGGGGGFTCEPQGIFALLGPPAYTAYEDSTVGGNVGLTSGTGCWEGLARLQVGGNVRVIDNQMNDPDAIEIVSNQIDGNLNCQDNSMVWDSGDLSEDLYPRVPQPNTVDGKRLGDCVLASPATEGGPPGPGPF